MTPAPSSAPIALITGGSRGLGRNAALHLVQKQMDVILTYRSSQDEALAVVQQIEAQGGRAAALQLDVSQTATFPAFVASLQALLARHWQRARIDHLVNNGGTGLHLPLAQTTEAQFDALLNVHLKGPFFLTQALAPMIQDGGSILNISSGLTRFAVPGYGAYATMKGGLEVLSRYLAKELGSRGIRVNTLAPGAIETDFNGGALRSNAELNRFVASVTALGRAGLPDDIGPVVASLLSEDSHWITAQRIEASGGMFV
ncbi:SDR family oxidoreductase [Roseateles sp. SL47]|uniref:SDR family NAD(P)-dependent oxidoreductase n=1 Tax=Roseateles sp. SL47 TaxID=2995138 RepID=UPI00226E06BF|nr:SDR family oxidoreductase [Roseateles sp. SL47]WAC74472.1 SDR family oxidoreductase [Roseateles sp. SL47]